MEKVEIINSMNDLKNCSTKKNTKDNSFTLTVEEFEAIIAPYKKTIEEFSAEISKLRKEKTELNVSLTNKIVRLETENIILHTENSKLKKEL